MEVGAPMLYRNGFDQIETNDDEPLVIHRHGEKPGHTLIVFIHGLGGKRYATWTHGKLDPAKSGFPKFLYEDFDQLDVGLYAYRSLLGRLKFWKSIPLETEAKVLAARLRQLTDDKGGAGYRTILLAGHSMGGILARAAIADLIRQGDARTLGAIKALLLMATPQGGSLRVPRFLSWLTSDSQALRAHGAVVTRIQEALVNHVVTERALLTAGKYHIPSYVVAAAEDNWVDRFTAGLNVTADYMNLVRGSHFSAVKPRSKDDDAYSWVKAKLAPLLGDDRAPLTLFEDFDLAGKLLIDRAPLRKNVRDLLHPEGRARIVAVKGKPRCGKSHSFYLIEHVEQVSQFEKVIVDLVQFGSPADFWPRDLADSLLQRLQRDATHIPEKTAAQTEARWVQSVAQHIVGHIRAKGGLVLIILDGFAHPSLPTPTRDLVRQLIYHSDRERSLRIVLLDCDDELLVGQAAGRLVTENVTDITDDDLKRFFRSLARASGAREPSEELLTNLVQTVRTSVAEARAGAPQGESDNERIGRAAEVAARSLTP